MTDWTKETLERLIADSVEESLGLEYKAAGALEKTDAKRTEITKDVSAFANSSGGNLIYGISEFKEKEKRHLPERLDPIDRRTFSKEWLEQVIQSIQPRIDGVIIYPVFLQENANEVCYVIEIPQSHTAHQARDRLYYKRHNFNVLAMEDYELRDVMGRRKQPKIGVNIRVNFLKTESDFHEPTGIVLVKLENQGRNLTRFVMVEVEIPVKFDSYIDLEPPAALKNTADGFRWVFRLNHSLSPLFPDSDVILRQPFKVNVQLHDINRSLVPSSKGSSIKVYADEMQKMSTGFDFGSALNKWLDPFGV